MRAKLLAIAAALAVLAIGAVWSGGDTARADNGPHQSGASMTTDGCAGCHRAHTGKSAYLLAAAGGATALCETCHDGNGATTNVLGGVSTGGGALRGGGFDEAAILTTDDSWRFSVSCTPGQPVPGYPLATCPPGSSPTSTSSRITFCGTGSAIPANPADCSTTIIGSGYQSPETWLLHIGVTTAQPVTSKHDLEVAGTAWGAGAAGAGAGGSVAAGVFECTSCHDPHGNNQYRILRPNPASTVGLAGTFTGGVTVPDACPGGSSTSCNTGNLHSYTTENYMNATYVTWTTGSTDGMNTALTTETGISAWCSQCHQRYLSRSQWGTDSGDPIFAYRHSTEGSLGYNGRQCNTCHVAHGTNAAATGYAADETRPDGTGSNGSALLKMDNRGMCQKCHKH